MLHSPIAIFSSIIIRDVLTKLLEHSMLMLFVSGSEHVIHRDPTKGISHVIIVLGLSNSVLRWRSLVSGLGHLRVKRIEVSAELIER